MSDVFAPLMAVNESVSCKEFENNVCTMLSAVSMHLYIKSLQISCDFVCHLLTFLKTFRLLSIELSKKKFNTLIFQDELKVYPSFAEDMYE